MFVGTPLLPCFRRASVILGSRRVQSAFRRATFLSLKDSRTEESLKTVALLV